jgi:hypothetical protein
MVVIPLLLDRSIHCLFLVLLIISYDQLEICQLPADRLLNKFRGSSGLETSSSQASPSRWESSPILRFGSFRSSFGLLWEVSVPASPFRHDHPRAVLRTGPGDILYFIPVMDLSLCPLWLSMYMHNCASLSSQELCSTELPMPRLFVLASSRSELIMLSSSSASRYR